MFESVTPISPPAPYLGGKKNLAEQLIYYIQATPHKSYAEPFFGMGGVFFRRSRVPKGEIINDISHDVFNLFRVVQRHYRELVHVMRFQMSSRRAFELFLRTNPDLLTDIERAARFYYLQKLAFGGKIMNRCFGVDADHSRFNIRQLKKHLLKLHERLAGVTVECLHYSDFIRRYDGPDLLFYLDPPYWGCEDDYGKLVFGRDDFTQLAEQLSQIKGKFILSLNDTEGVREVFAQFHIQSVETVYSISGQQKQVGEVIISNYPLPDPAQAALAL